MRLLLSIRREWNLFFFQRKAYWGQITKQSHDQAALSQSAYRIPIPLAPKSCGAEQARVLLLDAGLPFSQTAGLTNTVVFFPGTPDQWQRSSSFTHAKRVLEQADLTAVGINGRVLIDCDVQQIVLDFHTRKVSAQNEEEWDYRFHIDHALLEYCILHHEEDWINQRSREKEER